MCDGCVLQTEIGISHCELYATLSSTLESVLLSFHYEYQKSAKYSILLAETKVGKCITMTHSLAALTMNVSL